MGISQEPNFAYGSANSGKFFAGQQSLGNITQSNIGPFDDPEGLRATGKNFVAYSVLMDNGDIIDYDKDFFTSEPEANSWLDMAKQSDFHYKRMGIVVPVESQSKVETQLINKINTGDTDKGSEHEGSLPKSDGQTDNESPHWGENSSYLQKLKYIESL